MTEKRFEYNHLEEFQAYIYDVDDNHMITDLKIICELLNQLNDENEQLKKELLWWKYRCGGDISSDDKMTKYQYNVDKNTIECDGDFVAYVNSIDGFRIANKLTVLAEENEQLREEIKDFQDLLANRESELLKPVWDKIYSEFENIVYAEKGAIINLLNECYDEIMKKELEK